MDSIFTNLTFRLSDFLSSLWPSSSDIASDSLTSSILSNWGHTLNLFCDSVSNNSFTNGNYSGLFLLGQSELNSFVDFCSFTPFQLKLVKEFSLIILGNSALVLLAWKVYGPRISRFISAKKSRLVMEELRSSMSELKLPEEHDFKYK